ncbi:MAG: OmpA family protein [Saprospiraceae bacterium]
MQTSLISSSSLCQWALMFMMTMVVCSCGLTKEIKNGEAAYEQKKYALAADMLKDEHKKQSNKRNAARLSYLLGSSYEILNEIQRSIRWYEKAVRAEYGEQADRGLARVHKQSGNYAAALDIWKVLSKVHTQDQMIKREMQILKLAAEWDRDRQNTTKIFALDGNSLFNDYISAVYEGNYLVFTSDRKDATGSDDYKWTGNKYSDLFIMDKEGRGVRRFDAEINSNFNEGAACFTQDFNKIIFTRCSGTETADSYCKLMYAKKKDGLWTEPQVINFVVDNINYGQPALIENDSVMVFCTKGPDGPGGYDLYYSELVGDDEWSSPYLMPQSINTAGNEYFPTSCRDTLYFSSDYHPGLGGLDIFKTYLKDDGGWAAPENVRQPINSSYDDFGLVIDEYARLRSKEIEKGFFSTSRGKNGRDNIYSFTKYQLEEIQKDTVPTEDPKDELAIYLAGKVITDRYDDDEDPNSAVTGLETLSDARVEFSGELTLDRRSGKDGLFIEKLDNGKTYRIKASKPGYLSKTIKVSTRGLNLNPDEKSYTINVEIKLDKIFYDKEIILKEIYYDYNKWAIVDAAKPTLDRLSIILRDNPQIRIQLSSHTDCRGEDDYNAELSQKRAQSAVLYLVDRGIPFDRLQAQGYGESQLAVHDCECESCVEAQHKVNRRTTFKILR